MDVDIERPRQRQHHHKSRKGCLQCKRRRVKCCETRPTCEACIRLDLPCTWPNVPEPITELPISEAVLSRAPSPWTRTLAVDQLELLHHWILYTAPTLSTHPGLYRVFTEDILTLGFKHSYVLAAVLSMAAVHKAINSREEGERHRYACIATDFMNRGLEGLRLAVPHIIETNFEPGFVLAILQSMYHLALIQAGEPPDWIAYLVEYMHFIRCIANLIRPHRAMMLNHNLGLFLSESSFEDEPEVERIHPLLLSLDRAIIGMPASSEEEMQEQVCCKHALDALSKIRWYAGENGAGGRYIAAIVMSWPALISDQFTDLLVRHHRIALWLLAEWLEAFELCRAFWWIFDSVPQMRAGVAAIRENQGAI